MSMVLKKNKKVQGDTPMASIARVIKYEGDNSTFIWKHPCEDFNTASQLIVHETQEAVLFRDGQALDLFTPGKYTLKTQNIPFLRHIINLPTGGKTPFHCEIYFINKVQQMTIKWGTDSQVQYMEPTYHFPLQIGISGEMILSVDNSRKLLIKVNGTEQTLTQTMLIQKFRALLNSKIKPYIAKNMQEAAYSIFEVDSHIDEFSKNLQDMLMPDFFEYGLKLEHFFITNIAKPNGDNAYEKFKNLHVRQYTDVAEARLKQQVDVINEETEKRRKIIEAEGIAEKRKIEGYTYEQERGFDVSEKIAANEGVGNFSTLGIGLGTMSAISNNIGGMTENSLSQAKVKQENDSMATFRQKLEKLMIMKETGILSNIEFEEQKRKLIENI